jgi:Domain of unknown function (DUF4190)
MSMPPSGDQPAYVDPVTGQPLYIDPATGQLAYTDPAAPTDAVRSPYPMDTSSGYGAPTSYPTPGYAAPDYSASGYSTPGYSTPGYTAPGYAAPGYPTSDPGAGVPSTGFTTPTYSAANYGYTGYGVPMAALQQRSNPLAITAMVLAIVGAPLLFCDLIGSLFGLAGAILGHVAHSQIKARGEAGDGMAIAGIAIGWSVFGIALVLVIIVVLVLADGSALFAT